MSTMDARIPPGQHLVKGWPVLHYGPIPRFDESEWRLRLYGEVENEMYLTYAALKALPNVKVKADFHCVTKFSVLDNEWEGVAFKTLIALAKPLPEASYVLTHAEYSYTANLPLDVLADDDVLVAWGRNGEALTAEHGFPLRLIVPKRYAWKSTKWLRGIEFRTRDARGFWEERGYHNAADPWREERYSYQEE